MTITRHFFSMGEHVIYAERGLSGAICLREYEVSELLGDGDSPQYQLVCADQSHHRIVSEQEIRNAADTIRPPALLQHGEVRSPKRQKPMLTDPALLAL